MASGSASLGEVARRYAKAYLELVDEGKALKQAETDLLTLKQLVEGDEAFQAFIRNPVPSRNDQLAALLAIAKKAKLSKLTINMLGTVCNNRRLPALPQIVRAIDAGLRDRKGELVAEVSAAKQLSAKQQEAVIKTLAKAYGKNVSLNVTVDESLLGGLVVKVGSFMVDDSVKTKLQRLTREMKGAA